MKARNQAQNQVVDSTDERYRRFRQNQVYNFLYREEFVRKRGNEKYTSGVDFPYLLLPEVDYGPHLLSKNEKITRQEICPPHESLGKSTKIVDSRTKIPEFCGISTENYQWRWKVHNESTALVCSSSYCTLFHVEYL